MSAGATPDGDRLHRVTLCAQQFFEIEVMAGDAAAAFQIAERLAPEARLKFATRPAAHRAEILRLNDPRDASAGTHWEEVRRNPLGGK